MNTPQNLLYTKNHEWFDPNTGKTGITDFAQSELGDIVFVNLPQADTCLNAGETLCDLESVKAVSDVFAPVSGTVSEVNETLLDAPETINETPYDAWFVVLSDAGVTEELMDAAAYEAFCATAH